MHWWPEAHAQHRRGRAQPAHDLGGDAGFTRRARAGRDDDVRRRQRLDVLDRLLVAAPHHGLAPQLVDVARQVVDERVAVVEDEHNGGLKTGAWSLEPGARHGSTCFRGCQHIDRGAGLVERFAVFLLGVRVGDDAAAGAEVYAAVAHHRRADGDVGVERAGHAPVADRPAVDAAARRLALGDDLHRAQLGRARDRAAGKRRAQRIERVGARRQVADDRRHQVVHGGVALQREQLRHADAARRAHARQVVAHQVHDHQVLGPVLRALGQRLTQRRVVLGTEAARAGALDRPRLDVARRVHVQEPLGRRADDGGVRQLHESGERRRVVRAQPAIERPRRLGAGGFEPLRQVGLEDVAGEDVLAHLRHLVQVGAVRERRPQLEAVGPPPAFDRIRRGHRGAWCVAARGRWRRHGRPAQPIDDPGRPCLGAAGSRVEAGLGQPGRDQPGLRRGVVPGHHPVVEAQHHVVQAEVVVPRRGQPLEREPPVVADVPGRAALKRRQPGLRSRRMRSQQAPHGRQVRPRPRRPWPSPAVATVVRP